MSDGTDYEELAERLETLMVYALEPVPEGQARWRIKGQLREPFMHKWVTEVLALTRSTAAELREMAARLDQAALMYESWLRSAP